MDPVVTPRLLLQDQLFLVSMSWRDVRLSRDSWSGGHMDWCGGKMFF